MAMALSRDDGTINYRHMYSSFFSSSSYHHHYYYITLSLSLYRNPHQGIDARDGCI